MHETRETPAPPRRVTSTDLRRMPRDERRRIFAEQAALAEAIYRDNPELSDLGDLGLEFFDHDDAPPTP